MNRLIIEELDAGYGTVAVLHDISLELGEGELVALLGMNGNGKSTLMHVITGFIKPTRGRIRLQWDNEEHDLLALKPHEIVNHGIALVPEGRRLVQSLSVEENLILAGSCARGRDRLKRNLDFCFATFPILHERRSQRTGTMSGGQQQLLAIARAMMTSPRIMIVDEPSVGLAPIVVNQVFDAIRELQLRQKMTILMAEQSFFQTIDLAARAHVLSHGAIVRSVDRNKERIDLLDLQQIMMGMPTVASTPIGGQFGKPR